MKQYIEYDESEYQYYTDVTPETLEFITDMYGAEVRDRLLVPRLVVECG